MSCIANVCKCVLLKGKRYDDVDFNREHYVAIYDFEACVYHCQNEVPERFRRFRKNCRKSRLATYTFGENLYKCFSRNQYAWSDLTEIVYRKKNDPWISLLQNCRVNVLVLYPPEKWEKTTWNYLYKDKGFIVIFFRSLIKIIL